MPERVDTMMNLSGKPDITGRLSLAQAVVQLDWRVSQLTDALALTEHQVPRVRMIIANAMAQWASRRGNGGTGARERIAAVLSPPQRARFNALLEHDGELLLPS